MRTLTAAGHAVRQIDLYALHFNPVMARVEWHAYFTDPDSNRDALSDHIDALVWAEALCLIYPTWNYGPPAILKGWFERVFLPGVAFEVPDGNSDRIRGKLTNIRQLIVLTTLRIALVVAADDWRSGAGDDPARNARAVPPALQAAMAAIALDGSRHRGGSGPVSFAGRGQVAVPLIRFILSAALRPQTRCRRDSRKVPSCICKCSPPPVNGCARARSSSKSIPSPGRSGGTT